MPNTVDVFRRPTALRREHSAALLERHRFRLTVLMGRDYAGYYYADNESAPIQRP